MKTIKLSLCLLAALLAPRFASALLVGPYTPDANTLFLLHFDEPAGGSVTTNIGLKGGNFYTVTNTTSGNGLAEPPPVTTTLGFASYTGFSNAVTGTNIITGLIDGVIGYDGNKNGAFDADVQGGPASPDAIALTNLNIGNGGVTPFTLEALICPSIITANQEVICTDDYNGTRGFQFKITGSDLQFNLIGVGSAVTFPIPTSGTHKFVPGEWYHVAAVYNGTTLSLYWTQLDPSNSVANLLGSVNETYGASTTVAPLIIGAENRGSTQESFQGLIDEVRISSVARAANGMQFYSPTVTVSPNPISQNIDDNQPVTFTVSASSLTTLGYQWRFNGIPIPGASAFATNTSSYSIASVTLTNVGNYDCVVTNISGNSATSTPAMLVVGAGNFLSHRYSFTADTSDSIGGAWGTNYGDATVSGGKLVLDGTTGTYMELPSGFFHNLQAATFEFWASYGTISGNNEHVFDFGDTNGVALGVPDQPNNYLFFSPHSGTVNRLTGTPGTDEFEQTASATGILDGQTLHVTCVVDAPDQIEAIYTNGVLEAVNTNYTIPFLSLSDQLAYVGRSLFDVLNGDAALNASIDEFRIYNGALSANSIAQSDLQGPNLVLNDGPVQVTNQPASTTTAPGLTVTFSGLAVGHSPITYQWFENGGLIPGATNITYSVVASLGQSGYTFQLMATNNITGTNYTAASTNATLTVVNPPTLVWLGQNSAVWDTSTLNWTNTSTALLTNYALLDSALFDDRGSGQPNVNLALVLNPLAVTVNSAANYSFTSSGNNGSLTGSGTLTKADTGTLTVDVTNSLTGSVLISGGTLQIGNNDTLGAIGSPVTNNASLVLDRSDATVLPSPIYGTGTVTMNSGNVTASSSNSYTGATFINSGITMLANAAGLGATNGGISVASGAELYITANVDVGDKSLTILGSGVSSAGALRKGGAGVTTYYGLVTLASDTTLSVDGSATLNLTNSAGLAASSSANLTLAGSGAGNITGPLSLGSGNLTVSGGTWTVAPSNNFSGLTTLNSGGVLRITGGQSLGPVPGSFNAGEVTFSTGGTLDAATNITLNDGNIGITLSASSTIAVDSGATFNISNQITSSSGVNLTKSSPGTLVLSGPTTLNSELYVDTGQTSTGNDGTLVIANNAAIASLLALAGTPVIQIRNENAASSTLGLDGTLGSITISPDISLAGRNNTVAAIDNVAGNNTISGNITIDAGGGIYALQSDSGTLTLSASLPYATPTNSLRTFTFMGAGNIAVPGTIQNGSSTGTSNIWINVIKTGAGLLSLPAANTYSGFTTVSNGVLLLNGGTIGNGPVTVMGGLLVGNGTITGPVTVQSAGAIEAGATNSIGTLTLSGTLALSGNTLVKINKAGPGNDQFTGQTSVTYGGTLTVTNLAGTLTTSDTFTLFSPGASASNFAGIVGSPGAGLKYTFTNGVLGVAVGIKPTPHFTSVSVSGTTLTISGTNGAGGGQYVLLGSTNVALPLIQWTPLLTNMFDGSGNFNLSTNIVNPALPQEFYILSQ